MGEQPKASRLWPRGSAGVFDSHQPRARSIVLAAVFLLGAAHALLYAVSFPPWAIEDEEQHVDYAWKLSFDRAMPSIEDPIDESIITSVASTGRHARYGHPPPPGYTPEQMGMEGWSYEAYHPPLAYAGLAVVAQPFGDRALVVMYALRFVSVVAAGLTCVVVALLAWRWWGHAPARAAVALAAGASAALLPAMADSGGRVNIDIFAALIVAAGTLLAQRWLESPSPGRAWAVGAVVLAGGLTRETAVVLIVPLLVVGVMAARRRTLHLADVGRGLLPAAIGLIAWFTYHWRLTGHLDPADALRARHGAHHPYLGLRDFIGDMGDRAIVPYLSDWPMSPLWTVLVLVVAVSGLVLAVRSGSTLPAVIAAGTLALAVALMFHEALADSSTVTARLLLPAYPLVVAAAVVGWSRTGRVGLVVVPGAVAVVSAVFYFGSFLPLFPPELG